MIGKLTGTIETHTKNPLLIDVHGVGYLVHVPNRILTTIQPGKTHSLYIHTHVREDALDLFGFSSEEDLGLFDLLLTVSGIGPKTALAIVDRGADGVETAVRKSDVDFFTSIPRLGTKNAQKIIIELKSKLGSSKSLDLSGESGDTKDIVNALIGMGFEKHEIKDVIRKLDPNDSVEKNVRLALKLLAK